MGRRSGTAKGDEHWENEASTLIDPQTGEPMDARTDLGPFYDRYAASNDATFFDERRTSTTSTSPGAAGARPRQVSADETQMELGE